MELHLNLLIQVLFLCSRNGVMLCSPTGIKLVIAGWKSLTTLVFHVHVPLHGYLFNLVGQHQLPPSREVDLTLETWPEFSLPS